MSYLYSIDSFGQPVGQGLADAKYVDIHGVAKSNSSNSPFAVPNEFICGRLALLIGLPVPPGAVARTGDDGEPIFVALRFGPDGQRPPPVRWRSLLNDHPALASGIATFDCWIGNDDRHEENVSYVPKLWRPMIFDHDRALLGASLDARDDIATRLNEKWNPRYNWAATHLKTDEHFGEWRDRVNAIRPKLLSDVCTEAVEERVLSLEQSHAVQAYLEHRRQHLGELLRRALPNVAVWRLV